MNFLSNMRSALTIAKKASSTIEAVADVAATASPIIGMVKGVVETIKGTSDGDGQKAAEMYREMAVDLCEISAAILRATKDGEVTKEEQEAILKEIYELVDSTK